ncbi:MAG: flagellar motor protein MotB [Synergistaceae bacterium]|nr:flagellar motor protein MotB [Synergistaceae bacterium]
MARRKRLEEGKGGGPGWLATYADMITLILCFFVLLFAFSNLDVVKFEQMATSFQRAFNLLPGGPSSSNRGGIFDGGLMQNPGDTARETDSNQLYTSSRVLALVQRALKDDSGSDQVTFTVSERGVVISLSEQMLFAEGSAKLQPEAMRIIYKIGSVLNRLPNQISVEGHTDSGIPERSIYIDNWGLSSARASRVTAYLNEQMGIPQNRLRAVGFGASAPLVPNNSEENMRLNRRVDIVIMSLHSVR